MPNAVSRIGDEDQTHCSVPIRIEGSNNVFCNGIPVSRQGDLNSIHDACNDNNHQAPYSNRIFKRICKWNWVGFSW